MTVHRLSHPEAQAVLSDRDLEAADILTSDEADEYDRLRSERRRGEWLAARVAAKELVGRYARDFTGIMPDLADIVVDKDDQGAPHVRLRGEAGQELSDLPLPNLTLTHAAGVAIAGVAGPGSPARIGLDLEAIEERDDNFAENYFTEAERSIEVQGADEPLDRPTQLTVLWSTKEAVSKALGLGLKLALGELIVDDLRADNGRMVATVDLGGKAAEAFDDVGGESLEVRVRVDGTFALASAHILLEDGAVREHTPTPTGDEHPEGNGSSPATTTDEGHSKEFAAVAALLKHKGLLDAERTRKTDETPDDRDEVSNWKQSQ
jgi:phosphopantetheinyl transferase (holo-ACP synthase)